MSDSQQSIEQKIRANVAGTVTLEEAARACAASGLNPIECAPALYDLFPTSTAPQMAKALVLAWKPNITPETTVAAMQGCVKKDGSRAYTDAEIQAAVDAEFVRITQFDLVCVDVEARCVSLFFQGKIRWKTTAAHTVAIEDILTKKQYTGLSPNGEMNYPVNGRYQFRMTCTGDSGSATQDLKNPPLLGKLTLAGTGGYLGVQGNGQLAMMAVDKTNPAVIFEAYDQGNEQFSLKASNRNWVQFSASQSPIAWYEVLYSANTGPYPTRFSFEYFDPAGRGVKFAFVDGDSVQVAVFVDGMNPYCKCVFDVAMGWGLGDYFQAR